MAKVGNYRLLGQLGQGGMADIMLAVLETGSNAAQFTKLVVLKRLRLTLDTDHVTMFFDEARLAARLNHPNVVQTNEVGESQGVYFMVMEYLQGQSFDRVLRKMQKGVIQRNGGHVDVCLFVLAESLSGLHYAHDVRDFDGTELGLVHRDFSPHNVFVTYDGQVKVLDFGVAKAERRSHHTSTGLVKGKLRYMAPEQAMAMPVDRRADLFAAGVLLFEIVSGNRMWHADATDADVLRGLFEGKFPTQVKGASPAHNAILSKALAPKPAARYATAAQMRRDILDELRSRGRDLESLREELAGLMRLTFAEDRAQVERVIRSALATSTAAATPRAEPESGRFELKPIPEPMMDPASLRSSATVTEPDPIRAPMVSEPDTPLSVARTAHEYHAPAPRTAPDDPAFRSDTSLKFGGAPAFAEPASPRQLASTVRMEAPQTLEVLQRASELAALPIELSSSDLKTAITQTLPTDEPYIRLAPPRRRGVWIGAALAALGATIAAVAFVVTDTHEDLPTAEMLPNATEPPPLPSAPPPTPSLEPIPAEPVALAPSVVAPQPSASSNPERRRRPQTAGGSTSSSGKKGALGIDPDYPGGGR